MNQKLLIKQEEYKQTELGELPVGWEILKLEEITLINMGQSPPGETYNEKGEGFPFLQGKAEFTDLYPKNIKFTTKPLKIAKVGSILISVRAPVGDTNIADKDYCIGRGLAAIEPRDCDRKFLLYSLGYYKRNIENEGYGSTFKAINKNKLQRFKIPLPPLPEQQNISCILSTIQESQRATEQVINSLKELKKSLMKHLFKYGPVKFEDVDKVKLKETEIGEVPIGWELARLKNIASVKYGKQNPKRSGDIPVVGSSGIYAWTDRPLISTPTLIIGRKGTAGEIHLFSHPCYPSDTTFYLEINIEKINITFLYYFMKSHKLSGEYAKTTVPSITRPDLENLMIPLLPLSTQQQISSILFSLDQKIETEQKRKLALSELFNSMLKNLMTAKVRVKDLNSSDSTSLERRGKK